MTSQDMDVLGKSYVRDDGIVNFGEDREAVRAATRPRMCTRANHNSGWPTTPCPMCI